MTAQEYIKSKLQELSKPLQFHHVDDDLLEQTILSRVHSKKFRKLRADQSAIDTAKKAISWSVADSQPIHLRLDFGGNKLWRLDESPDIDWAELFSMLYFVEWARYICEVYSPGVVLTYFSMDVCVDRMNNIKSEETKVYTDSMRALIHWISDFIPSQIQIEYSRYGDLYESIDAYDAEIEESKRKILEESDGKLPSLDEKQIAATELNVRLKPGQDDDPQWREKVELEHEAIFGTKALSEFGADPKWIPHCSTWYSGYIATGSTKRSMAKFWAGVGALERKNDEFTQLVLSPKQLEKADFTWEDVSIDGLNGENFSRIRVLQ